MTRAQRKSSITHRDREGDLIVLVQIFQLLKNLKGLGHAILGNFSIDQMVIELTKI